MSDVLIALLVAVLAWPWNLALPAADSVELGSREFAHAQFRAKRPTRSSRSAHARRWSVSTTTAYWEDNDEEAEGRGGKVVDTSRHLVESSVARGGGYSRPASNSVARQRSSSLGTPLDRLCPMRC